MTNLEAKQEAIKKAYSEYYIHADKNGWIRYLIYCPSDLGIENYDDMDGFWRCKSLQGIETYYSFIDIKGFENYKVNKQGVIVSKSRVSKQKNGKNYTVKEKIMKPQIDNTGYIVFGLRNSNKKTKKVYLHRILAEHFIPNPENKPQVNHINGIKTDNMVENLEWCTSAENIKHAHENKLKVQLGGKNPNARKVINNKTKEIFNCINDARENTKYSYSYFYNMLNGTYKNKTDFEFHNSPIY